MSVKFGSGLRDGIFTAAGVRPQGYHYPIGLKPIFASGNAAQTSTGGSITISGSNAVHTFTVSGTFIPGFTGVVEYLIVAGGGGGGSIRGGGGGAGGLRYASGFAVESTRQYVLTVGSGGLGGGASISSPIAQRESSNGSNSSIISSDALGNSVSIISTGGGRGGGRPGTGPGVNGSNFAGDGGSGGGAMGDNPTGFGSGVPGQGNSGGPGPSGGGGGGAGGAGGAGPGGAGGIGTSLSISGTATAYANGGTAGTNDTGGNGGPQIPFGPPATSAVVGPGAATSFGGAGLTNRGGGGGGGFDNSNGGNGGPGIVIVRYVITQNNTVSGYSIN